MNNGLKYWKYATIVLIAVAVLLPFGIQYFESSEYSSVFKSITRQRVPVDAQVLKDYVGTYQLRPGFNVEVTSFNGKLFAQATSQQRIEFHAASDAVFFNDITPPLMKFERDDEGEVIRFRALEPGRSRVAVKIEVEVHDSA